MKAENEKGCLNQSLSEYEPPTMETFSEEELFEEMETVSVQACQSYNPDGVIGNID